MTVTLGQPLTSLASIAPVVRNSNLTGTHDKWKAGPNPAFRVSDTDLRMMVEWHNSDLIDGNSNWSAYLRSTDRGISWQVVAGVGQPVAGPASGAAGWENGELCISTILYDSAIGWWIAFYHGGNNPPGVRHIGRMMARTAQGPWIKDAGNPILSPSATGTAQDDVYVADFAVRKLASGTYVGLYRGQSSADNRLRIFRATSTDRGVTWTKRGVCLDVGTAGQWDDESVAAPWWFVDANGTTHLWYAGGGTTPGDVVAGVGYASTTTDLETTGALTFSRGASNPVAQGTGVATDLNHEVGDVITGYLDADLVLVHAGASNTTGSAPSYNGSTRFEGRWPYYEPLESDNPARGARHYRTFAGASVQFSSLPTTVQVFNHDTLIVYGEFKCPRHNTTRQLYTAQLSGSFRQEHNVKLTSAGLLGFYIRSDPATTATELQATSAAGTRYDDNKRRWFLLRRTGASAAELIVGDETGWSVVASASGVSPALVTGTTYPAFGNFHTSGSFVPGNEPTFGTIGGVMLVLGGTITAADALAYFNARTVPTPSGGTLYRWQLGASSTTTDAELGGAGVDITHTGSPVRVEWMPAADVALTLLRPHRARILRAG